MLTNVFRKLISSASDITFDGIALTVVVVVVVVVGGGGGGVVVVVLVVVVVVLDVVELLVLLLFGFNDACKAKSCSRSLMFLSNSLLTPVKGLTVVVDVVVNGAVDTVVGIGVVVVVVVVVIVVVGGSVVVVVVVDGVVLVVVVVDGVVVVVVVLGVVVVVVLGVVVVVVVVEGIVVPGVTTYIVGVDLLSTLFGSVMVFEEFFKLSIRLLLSRELIVLDS